MTDTAIARASKGGQSRTALIAFLPAAFPDPQAFEDACRACVRGGADVLEIGLSAEAPPMEGDVVRQAFSDAGRFSWETRVESLSRAASLAPVIGMTHETEPVRVEAFIRDCSRAGARDVLLPNLPVEQQLELAQNVDVGVGVFVSSRDDLAQLTSARLAASFVYVRSSGRATGDLLDAGRASNRIRDVHHAVESAGVPVVVGFGVESAEQVTELSMLGVGGVVVGTAVVRAAAQGPAHLETLVAELAAGARKGNNS